MTEHLLAVDLGATSGRVVSGRFVDGNLHYETIHRFPNEPIVQKNGLHWGLTSLYSEILRGMRMAATVSEDVAGIGVDSWAVDYGLLGQGKLLAEPFHYRDKRNLDGVATVHEAVAFEELFQRNGLQFLPFNTLYQLATEDWARYEPAVDHFLLIPDLVNYWLTGVASSEITNASTTGLVGVNSSGWDQEIIRLIGAPKHIFTEIGEPGNELGSLSSEVVRSTGLTSPVFQVASHDTASAIVAVPMNTAEVAYISCGTWGLVGQEISRPILSDEAVQAKFTNERGADHTFRLLRNVMGLWLLNESVNYWSLQGATVSLSDLLSEATSYRGPVPVFDVNDPVFVAPGDVPRRITSWLRAHDLPVPDSLAGVVAAIIRSLAVAFSVVIREVTLLSKVPITAVHIVGGGAQNAMLCQAIADVTEMPVFAGPVEATSIGNLLIQARALGWVSGDLWSMRSIVRRSVVPVEYQPWGGGASP